MQVTKYKEFNVSEILFFTGIFVLLLLPIKVHFEIYDEGIILTGAMRILGGELPYKDFWTIYPPGQFYIVALILKLFGNSIFFTRIFDTIIRFGILILIYFISKKFSSSSISKVITFLLSIIMGSLAFYSNSIFTCLLISFIIFVLFHKFKTENKQYLLWFIGILLALEFSIRWDFTFYTFNSIILSEFILFKENSFRAKDTLNNLLKITIGFSILFIPLILILNSTIGFNTFWYHNFILPKMFINNANDFTSPSFPNFIVGENAFINRLKSIYLNFFNWIHFYLPIVIYLVAGFMLNKNYLKIKGNKSKSNIFQLQIILLIMGIQLYLYAIYRYDYLHMFPTTLFAFIFVPVIIIKIRDLKNKRIKYNVNFTAISVFIFFLLFPFKIYLGWITSYPIFQCNSQIDQSLCFNIDANQEKAVDFIRSKTKPNEFIFVGNKRHDIISENDVGFYYLCNRRCATKYQELVQGLVTTEKIQHEIVDDLNKNNVNYIVVVNMPIKYENYSDLVKNSSIFLDKFISERFALIKQFGKYEIMKRKGLLDETF